MLRRRRRVLFVGLLLAGVALAAARRRTRAAGAPPAQSAVTATTAPPWIASEDGSCPLAHPVKANDRSRIYHLPGGRFYDRTIAERCYATPEGAERDGYRRAKA
jgi:hypothetical protein